MSYNGRIPVPGCVTSVRKSTREERYHVIKKRQEDKESLKKQLEREKEAAQILALRWQQEDGKKRKGDPAPTASERQRRREKDRDSSEEEERRTGRRPRRFRDTDEPPRRELSPRSREEQDRDIAARILAAREQAEDEAENEKEQPPVTLPQVEPKKVQFAMAPQRPQAIVEEERANVEEEPSGWQTIQESRAAPRIQLEQKSGEAAGSGQKRPQQNAPSGKFKGVFGLDESDEEKDSTDPKVIERNKKKAKPAPKTMLVPSAPERPAPGPGPGGTGPPPGMANSVAAVQMKVAAWKAGLKGKAAKMPVELQREVAAVMGTPPPP